MYAARAHGLGAFDEETERFVVEGLFTTVTNVNFDQKRIQDIILRSAEIKKKIEKIYKDAYTQKYKKDFDGVLARVC